MTDSMKPLTPHVQSSPSRTQDQKANNNTTAQAIDTAQAGPDHNATGANTTSELVVELANKLQASKQANFVQSIRAYSAKDLQAVAKLLDQHFLYANLLDAQSKHAVLTEIGHQFLFPSYFGKNLDALYDCLTSSLLGSGPQTGFLIVLEHIPICAKFDNEVREQLLDVFRDASEFWAEKKVPFRCFYSFY